METTDKNNLNDVQKLNSKQCNMMYIGETGRKFSTRHEEHETSQRLKDDKSLFGKHNKDKQHTNYNIINNDTILKLERNTYK